MTNNDKIKMLIFQYNGKIKYLEETLKVSDDLDTINKILLCREFVKELEEIHEDSESNLL